MVCSKNISQNSVIPKKNVLKHIIKGFYPRNVVLGGFKIIKNNKNIHQFVVVTLCMYFLLLGVQIYPLCPPPHQYAFMP
jgi:hypothetical protein